MLEETGVDAVMVARAALDNPWVIKQMNDFIVTGTYEPLPNLNIVVDEIINFFNQLVVVQEKKVALAQIRGIITN